MIKFESKSKIAHNQPDWICWGCGKKHGSGRRQSDFSTYHTGICGVCGKEVPVTEPRDFGYLLEGWDE